MKRKTIILFILPFLLMGCGSQDKSTVNNNSQTEHPVPVKTESFSKENYDSFPEIKNIVYYLKLPPKDVKIIKQTKEELIFCFIDNTEDVQDESYLLISNYVKSLEKDGYQMKLFDGTISSTFVLKKDNYTISTTVISDIKEWKEVHQDEMDTQKIDNEDTVCEISVNN